MLNHKHLLIRAEVNDPFTNEIVTKNWLIKLVQDIGMKITASGGPHVDYVDQPGNAGIAGVVVIETSHCSIHIWDRVKPALVQMDVYSCSDFDSFQVIKMLDIMNPIRVDWSLFDRENGIKLIGQGFFEK